MSDYLRKHLYQLERLEKLKADSLEAEARGDCEELNLLARAYINQGGVPTGRRFKDIFDLMDGKLTPPAGFDERVELTFYADMVRSEFKKVQGLESSAWQLKRIGELRCKEREINGLIDGKGGGNVEVSTFDRQLAVLREWLIEKGYVLSDKPVILEGLKIEDIYGELFQMGGDIFNVELSSFRRHFWSKQRVCKLKPGRRVG